MNPDQMYATFRIEQQLDLSDPGRAHRRELRRARRPWWERVRTAIGPMRKKPRTRLRRRPALEPRRAV